MRWVVALSLSLHRVNQSELRVIKIIYFFLHLCWQTIMRSSHIFLWLDCDERTFYLMTMILFVFTFIIAIITINTCSFQPKKHSVERFSTHNNEKMNIFTSCWEDYKHFNNKHKTNKQSIIPNTLSYVFISFGYRIPAQLLVALFIHA